MLPIRFWIAVMIFNSTAVNYFFRTHFQISLLGMRHKSNETLARNLIILHSEYRPLEKQRFKWTAEQERLLNSGFFYGYAASSPFSGLVAEYVGPKDLILWSFAFSGTVTFSSVWFTMDNWIPLFICRLVIGFSAGFQWPALQCLIGRWAPPNEVGKFSACLMGHAVGSLISMFVTGAISETFGWPWTFYLTTLLACLFCLAWHFTVTDYPYQHQYIKPEEVAFITEAQKGSVSEGKRVAPLLRMFTSIPFLVLIIFQFGNLYALYLLLMEVPTFLESVLKLGKRTEVDRIFAIPILSRLIFGFVFGVLSDFFISRKIMTKNLTRKSFTIFSHIIPGLLMFGFMGVPKSTIVVISLFVLLMGANGASIVTSIVNPQDLAPNFAGTQYGIMNFIGSTPAFFIPYMVDEITKGKNDMPEWRIIFGSTGGVIIFSGVLFILFGTTNIQPWNEKSPINT